MKFGDEHSNLLDQYERLSFEATLNQAMFGRSLSEPRRLMPQSPPRLIGPGSGSGSVRAPCSVTTTTRRFNKSRCHGTGSSLLGSSSGSGSVRAPPCSVTTTIQQPSKGRSRGSGSNFLGFGSSSGSVRAPCSVSTTTQQPKKGRCRESGSSFNFNKIINKLLKPILERKSKAKKEFPDFKNPMSWKALSKSMRL